MKKLILIASLATLGLMVALPSGAAGQSAHVAKKCKAKAFRHKKCNRKKKKVVVVQPPTPAPAPPSPLALTESEVTSRVLSRAGQYCAIDPDCIDYGYYTSGGHLLCASTSTYTWACYGWNDEDASFVPPNATCDFKEVVSRSGYNGISSYQDLSYGGSGGPGWDCY